MWLGEYAHKQAHRKQVHLRTSTKNSKLKLISQATTNNAAETGTTYFKEDTAPAHTSNSFSEIKISHVIMEIKKEVHNCHRMYSFIQQSV